MKFIKIIEEHRTNPRTFFRKYQSIKNGFKAQVTVVKNDNGHLLSDDTSIVNRFKSPFYSLLNVAEERCNAEKENYLTYYTVRPKILEPNLKEVKYIINILKNNKALGLDNTNAKLIKISTPEIMSKIHGIIKESWENGIIPQKWKTSIICPT